MSKGDDDHRVLGGFTQGESTGKQEKARKNIYTERTSPLDNFLKKYLTKSKKSFIIYIENNKGEKEMKIFRNIAIIITILFILWFIVSYIEITSQNLDFENETILSNWNLFKLFI